MSWLDTLVVQYRADQTLADIFGVILYTDTHANIKKVLRDEDYWRSFDEVSGRRLAVFFHSGGRPATPEGRERPWI